MEIVNKIVNKVGADKLIHFFVGMSITAFLAWFGLYGVIGGFILTIILSIIKEYLDDIKDWKDMIAGVLGSGVIVILYLILYETNKI